MKIRLMRGRDSWIIIQVRSNPQCHLSSWPRRHARPDADVITAKRYATIYSWEKTRFRYVKNEGNPEQV